MNILILFITNALFLWQTNSLKIILYVSREEGPTCVYHYLSKWFLIKIVEKSILWQQNLKIYRRTESISIDKNSISGRRSIGKMSIMLTTKSAKWLEIKLLTCSVFPTINHKSSKLGSNSLVDFNLDRLNLFPPKMTMKCWTNTLLGWIKKKKGS